MDDINEDQQIELDELAQAKLEAEQNLNGWKRSQADFENFKRRTEEQNKELVEFAKEVTVVKLLPTLDTLEQGLRHSPSEDDPEFSAKFKQWMNGIDGTLRQIYKILEDMGVKRIEALGKKFDPNFHEAVREVEGEEDGVVVEELQAGYELNGKVMRPSSVVISKKGN